MAEISTPQPHSSDSRTSSSIKPRQSTLDFIRQFARAYVAMPTASLDPIGGVLLN